MLPSAVQHIVSQVTDPTIHKTVKRIIQIWSERHVYQPDAIKLLKTNFDNGVRSTLRTFSSEISLGSE